MAKTPRVTVHKEPLWTLVRDIFAKLGASQADAGIVADVLVWANLRGIDSHGINRVPRYIELFEKGEAKANPNITVTRTRSAALVVEADGAPGPVAMTRAMNEAIAQARETGVAWAAVRGTVHTGAIGYYANLAAEANMIGIGVVAGIPNMGYHGARAAGVATSPLAIAVPALSHPTVLLDMATAVIALGRIQQLRAQGLTLPEGAAMTEAGAPTTDPKEAAIPLPMGGAKGSGMSLVFEFLTSVLVANPIVSPFHAKAPGWRRHRQNASLIAVDIAAFTDLAQFRETVDSTLLAVKGLPKADGVDEILYPGERGAKTYEQRLTSGISIPAPTWKELSERAAALGVRVPEAVE